MTEKRTEQNLVDIFLLFHLCVSVSPLDDHVFLSSHLFWLWLWLGAKAQPCHLPDRLSAHCLEEKRCYLNFNWYYLYFSLSLFFFFCCCLFFFFFAHRALFNYIKGIMSASLAGSFPSCRCSSSRQAPKKHHLSETIRVWLGRPEVSVMSIKLHQPSDVAACSSQKNQKNRGEWQQADSRGQ